MTDRILIFVCAFILGGAICLQTIENQADKGLINTGGRAFKTIEIRP